MKGYFNFLTKEIFYNTVYYVEDNIHTVFGECALDNKSLNEFYPSVDKCGEMSTHITVTLSDLWEKGLIRSLNENSDIIKEAYSYNTSRGDIKICKKENESLDEIELKTTQGNVIQGSTHSSMKVDKYILIKYEIDRNKKLHYPDYYENLRDKNIDLYNKVKKYETDNNLNRGIIKKIFACGWDKLPRDYWYGNASKNNSRTSLRIPLCPDGKIKICCGKLISKRIVTHMYMENIN